MAYKQIVTPNLDPYIKNGGEVLNDWLGWCLGYVTAAFSVPDKYKVWRAIWAWNGCVSKHTDRNFPKDVYFLIWFDHYGKYDNSGNNSWGHVAIAYLNSLTGALSIWSSPISRKPLADTWTSIEQVENNYSSQYLGWSEDNNGYPLIEYVADIIETTPTQRITAAKCYAREQPNTNAAVFQEVDANEGVRMKGYVTNGEAVEGNTTWFVTERSGKYMSAQVFTDTGTHDLADLTPVEPPVVAPPVVVEPKPVDDESYHIVVNKKHPLGYDYAPTDLVDVGNGQQMRKDAATMLKAMQVDSGANVMISPASGYRSYVKQQEVYNSYDEATRDTFSAKPGFSEHQTGLCIDFSPIDMAFENTTAYAWLKQNAAKYGYLERFPEGSETVTGYQHEPWHWRYVGTDAIKVLESGKVTLEEFYGVEGGNYIPTIPVPDPTPIPEPTPEPMPEPVESAQSIIMKFINALIALWNKLIGKK
jgi:zinc D-Ala-D-Ala carboxypeptidase